MKKIEELETTIAAFEQGASEAELKAAHSLCDRFARQLRVRLADKQTQYLRVSNAALNRSTHDIDLLRDHLQFSQYAEVRELAREELRGTAAVQRYVL